MWRKVYRPELLIFFRAFLNAVVLRLSLESRRLALVIFVLIARPERIRVGFASAFFERDNISFAVLSEPHTAVIHSLMSQIEGSRVTAFPPNKHHSPLAAPTGSGSVGRKYVSGVKPCL